MNRFQVMCNSLKFPQRQYSLKPSIQLETIEFGESWHSFRRKLLFIEILQLTEDFRVLTTVQLQFSISLHGCIKCKFRFCIWMTTTIPRGREREKEKLSIHQLLRTLVKLAKVVKCTDLKGGSREKKTITR